MNNQNLSTKLSLEFSQKFSGHCWEQEKLTAIPPGRFFRPGIFPAAIKQ